MIHGSGIEVLGELADRTHVPVIGMESPRGTIDPSLGAFAEVLAQADLIVLLGKQLDFTLRFGDAPHIDPNCRFIQIDPERRILEQTDRVSSRLLAAELADSIPAAQRLAQRAAQQQWPNRDWFDEVQSAVAYQPPQWATIRSPAEGPLHAVDVCRAVRQSLDGEDEAVLISDGGEFGQWAQACLTGPHRLINGPSGAIGSAIPFALASRLAFPESRIVTMLGDGTFGFHALEFDTAVRYKLPFVAVVGNDARWNAEHQIQLRDYGPKRLIGCELLPTRYDEIAKALGGHGENVTKPSELAPVLQRAFESNLPACVNVAIASHAAPQTARKE
jgi:acetolactate synthase-1/2/3 large subunit